MINDQYFFHIQYCIEHDSNGDRLHTVFLCKTFLNLLFLDEESKFAIATCNVDMHSNFIVLHKISILCPLLFK